MGGPPGFHVHAAPGRHGHELAWEDAHEDVRAACHRPPQRDSHLGRELLDRPVASSKTAGFRIRLSTSSPRREVVEVPGNGRPTCARSSPRATPPRCAAAHAQHRGPATLRRQHLQLRGAARPARRAARVLREPLEHAAWKARARPAAAAAPPARVETERNRSAIHSRPRRPRRAPPRPARPRSSPASSAASRRASRARSGRRWARAPRPRARAAARRGPAAGSRRRLIGDDRHPVALAEHLELGRAPIVEALRPVGWSCTTMAPRTSSRGTLPRASAVEVPGAVVRAGRRRLTPSSAGERARRARVGRRGTRNTTARSRAAGRVRVDSLVSPVSTT